MQKTTPILTAVIAALVLLCADATVADQTKADWDAHARVDQYTASLESAELEYATAKAELQFKQLLALRKLQGEGHASFRELTSAEIEYASLRANVEAAKEQCGFVAQATAAPDTPAFEERNAENAGHQVIVTVAGLNSHPSTRLLANIAIPSIVDAEQAVELQRCMNHKFANDRKSRTQAWGKLIERLDSLDDSDASQNEKQYAHLKRRVADAESRLATLLTRSVHRFDAAASGESNGSDIGSPMQWLTQFHANRDRLLHLAMAKASLDQQPLLEEWERRIKVAAANHASPSSELPSIQNRITAAVEQREFANRIIDTIALAKRKPLGQRGTDSDTQLVSQYNVDMNWKIGVPEVQLESARQVVLNRVLDAADRVEQTEAEWYRENTRHVKLARLANRDAFFKGEAGRAELASRLAEANHNDAVDQHRQRVLEHDYVMARIGVNANSPAGKPRKEWTKPLIELFTLRSTSRTKEMLARREMELARWRVDGLHKLYEDGAASWKELTAAEVALAESSEAAERAKADRIAAAAITQLLDQSIHSNSTDDESNRPTVASVR